MKRVVFVAAGLAIAASGEANAGLDGCAIVKQTPDGFLSLRTAPGVRFAEKGRLRPGDYLWVTDTSCAKVKGREICIDPARWRHVTSVRRLDRGKEETTEGWAYAKYLEPTECDDNS